MASSDTKCKRCGKEVPALSDCGGFYDLVPNAKKEREIQPLPPVPPVKPVNPPKPNPVKSKNNSKKFLLGLTALSVAGFTIAILLLAITLSKVNQCYNEIDRLRDDLQAMSEKIDVTQTATEPEETEPKVTEPEGTKPEETNPNETEPEGSEPEATEPEETEPEETEPEETEPETT